MKTTSAQRNAPRTLFQSSMMRLAISTVSPSTVLLDSTLLTKKSAAEKTRSSIKSDSSASAHLDSPISKDDARRNAHSDPLLTEKNVFQGALRDRFSEKELATVLLMDLLLL